MALHQNYGILTESLVKKLIKVKGAEHTYGLFDLATDSAAYRSRWYQASRKEKSRWEQRAWEGKAPDPPLLGGWRHIKIRFNEDPHGLIGMPCIVELCTERPRRPHPTLGNVPRWVVYFRRMHGARRIVRHVDIWRMEDDCRFALPEEKGQYGWYFWSHSLSLFDDWGERQLPRLVIYHPLLAELQLTGWEDKEEIEEGIRELQDATA